ncbi:MAG: DNA primase [Chloroflexi bacterium]|nr:MAG: DNA primase [Chloroflexota bacterium]
MPGDFDLVKERVDIVQLIGERVALKKAGRVYKGLCPFHAEKTPSFQVDPDRRRYHCFGCSRDGDVFTWLEEQDGLEPLEALRVLAERAGVELTTRRDPAERDLEKRLLAANDTAHFYFRQALRGTERGREVAAYLEGRGIRPETVERFGLGYAPDRADGLLSYLRKKGYSDDEAIGAGLVSKTERGLWDRFRDRLVVPIKDGRGRIVAFGGRAMRADQPGKYLNSPQTQLFNKSATLYGLDAARAAIRKERAAVIVEGYFDTIAMHQAGFGNVVASARAAGPAGRLPRGTWHGDRPHRPRRLRDRAAERHRSRRARPPGARPAPGPPRRGEAGPRVRDRPHRGPERARRSRRSTPFPRGGAAPRRRRARSAHPRALPRNALAPHGGRAGGAPPRSKRARGARRPRAAHGGDNTSAGRRD